MPTTEEMLEARARLVALMKTRGRALIELQVRTHLIGMLKGRAIATWRAQRRAEFPNTYYVGQEYIERSTLVRCTIEALFVYAGAIEPVNFWHLKNNITLEQIPPFLKVSLTRSIAQRLWDDINDDLPWGTAHGCVGAYLDAILPEVNRRLLAVRYEQGHLLSRTFHVSEAFEVTLCRGERTVRVRWPQPIAAFPPSAQLAARVKHLYVRELIDAMHAFLRNEYDECVRRLITSAEDFFRARGWNLSPRVGLVNRILVALRLRSRRKRISFRQSLTSNLEASSIPGSTLVPNLLTVYEVRNRIVHGGIRLHSSAKLFCHKAVSTLRYIIYYFCGDATTARFVYTLEMQLNAVLRQSAGTNLDEIARLSLKNEEAPRPPIETARDMDEAIFEALRFDERDLATVRS